MATKALRILVVDDHFDTVEAFQKLLLKDGHQVTTAQGFVAAKTLALEERFDVLLCDLGLPDGDGYSLLAEVRAVYPIRAVAITGHGMPDDVRRVAEAGFDGFLLKPVELQKLRSVVEYMGVQIEFERSRDQKAAQSPPVS